MAPHCPSMVLHEQPARSRQIWTASVFVSANASAQRSTAANMAELYHNPQRCMADKIFCNRSAVGVRICEVHTVRMHDSHERRCVALPPEPHFAGAPDRILTLAHCARPCASGVKIPSDPRKCLSCGTASPRLRACSAGTMSPATSRLSGVSAAASSGASGSPGRVRRTGRRTCPCLGLRRMRRAPPRAVPPGSPRTP